MAFVKHAGIHTFAVADHDTVAAVRKTQGLAADAGLACVPAVEITAVHEGKTAVHEGKDVHVLGYFIDYEDAHLTL